MIEALDHGADDFIAKPPAPEELRARLRAADRITSMIRTNVEAVMALSRALLPAMAARRTGAVLIVSSMAGNQPMPNFGAYAATPVVANGVIYSQDLQSNVQAIDLASGEVLWTKRYEELDQGPNGLVVQGGSVFGATATRAFALASPSRASDSPISSGFSR